MMKSYLLIVFSIFFISACDFHYTFSETQSVPLSQQDFVNSPGFKLDYEVHIPNSFTSWKPSPENQLVYNPKTQSYILKNLDITGQQIDSWGARFKIASADWAHEFAFAKAHDTPEQSKFGIKQDGSVVKLKQIFYASDIYFELPINSHAQYLQVEFKVTSDTEQPDALLYIYFTDSII
ncbi:hypothetical protein [Pseudoalteromonas gelatinilytica]